MRELKKEKLTLVVSLLTLGLVGLLSGLADAIEEERLLEKLVAESHLIMVGKVSQVVLAQNPKQGSDIVTVAPEEVLAGSAVGPKILCHTWNRSLGYGVPAVGERRIFFLQEFDSGLRFSRPEGALSVGVLPKIRQIIAIADNPGRYLYSQDPVEVQSSLFFLLPEVSHQERLLELLNSSSQSIGLDAARALSILNNHVAKNWVVAKMKQHLDSSFYQYYPVAVELFGRQVVLPMGTREERAKVVELFEIQQWLATPEKRAKAMGRLPQVEQGLTQNNPLWALEGLSLYPPHIMVPALARALPKVAPKYLGRVLNLLSVGLAVPDNQLSRLLEGQEGQQLRAELNKILESRDFSSDQVSHIVLDTRRVLFLLNTYGGWQEH